MTYVYVYTIQFRTGDNLDYSVVQDVFADKESVRKAAIKDFKNQRNVWRNECFCYRRGKGVVVLQNNVRNCSKTYIIKKQEIR